MLHFLTIFLCESGHFPSILAFALGPTALGSSWRGVGAVGQQTTVLS